MVAYNQENTNICWVFAMIDCLSVVEFSVDCTIDKVECFSVQQLMDFLHLHRDYQDESFIDKPIVQPLGVQNFAGNALLYVQDHGICLARDYSPYVGEINQMLKWDDQPRGMVKLFIRDFEELEHGHVDSATIFEAIREIRPLLVLFFYAVLFTP